MFAALAVCHGALILTTGSLLAIGAVITLAGATIAPTVSAIYAMVDRAAPAGTLTEAYSWQLTASLTGAAVRAAVAGSLAQSGGAPAAFALVAAGGVAVLVAALRSSRLETVTSNRDLTTASATSMEAQRDSTECPSGIHADPDTNRRKRRRLRLPRDVWDSFGPDNDSASAH